MKLYESIKRPDNYDSHKEPFEKGETITIQEKIDGSNTSIYNDNGKLRTFSRTNEITDSIDNFQDFNKFVKENEDMILKYLPNGYVIFGEWLGQAKIPYNKKAKQGLISRYYVFDIARKVENIFDEEKIIRYYLTPEESYHLSKNMLLPFVPIIEESITLNTFEELKEKYVNSQKSLIDNDCIREGIVIKDLTGTKRVKIVGDQFLEVKHKGLFKKEQNNPYQWLDKYITPARIQKFLMKVQENQNLEKITKDYYKNIFQSLDLLSEDILSEEYEAIVKEVGKIIRKNSIPAIKDYLEESK